MQQLGKKYFSPQKKWQDVRKSELPEYKDNSSLIGSKKTMPPLYSWRDEQSIERFNAHPDSYTKDQQRPYKSGQIHPYESYKKNSNSKSQDYPDVGPQGVYPSDKKLRESICDQLMQSPFIDASKMEIHVKKGIVTATGKIKDKWMLYDAEDIIDSIYGVKGLDIQVAIEEQEIHT